jgi:hypothetical protein
VYLAECDESGTAEESKVAVKVPKSDSEFKEKEGPDMMKARNAMFKNERKVLEQLKGQTTPHSSNHKYYLIFSFSYFKNIHTIKII